MRQRTSALLWVLALFVVLLAGVAALVIIKRGAPKREFAAQLRPPSSTPSSPEADQIPSLPDSAAPTTQTADQSRVQVFFTPDGARLAPQVMELPRALTTQERLKFALEELLKGPATTQTKSALPAGVQLRAAFVGDDMTVVDLSSAVSRSMGGATAEILCVYSIVNTVAASGGGNRPMRILVEGESPAVLWEQVDLSAPLSPDYTLVTK